MAFECRQCGNCCMFLGDYIMIEKQIAAFEFQACCVSTGTEFLARIDDDKHDLFADMSYSGKHPSACPFLRPSGHHVICTIHQTRPSQCRAFRCESMRIYSKDRTLSGIVNGSLALSSEDCALLELWEAARKSIPFYSPDLEKRLAEYIEQNGYIVL